MAFLLVGAAVPAAHAQIPYFGPIVPAAYNTCPGSWSMLMWVINNIISVSITLAIVFVAPIMIAWSGFLFVVNPFNAGGIQKAKDILTHTILGIVIALGGYLIVAAIMAVLYHPASQYGWQAWYQIISGDMNAVCLTQAGAQPGSGLNQATLLGNSGTGVLNPAQVANSACDPSMIQFAANSGNPQYPLSTTQANVLACIAKPESNCGQTVLNYNWGKGSSAAGAFQVLLSTNAGCYENKSCYDAAGVSGPLNCNKAFSKGNPDPGQSALVDQCVKAASNLNCSVSAAACLLYQNGGRFTPWTSDPHSQIQQQCISSGG